MGAEEMAQVLRQLAALAENAVLFQVPTRQLKSPITAVPGGLTSSSDLLRHVVHLHTFKYADTK